MASFSCATRTRLVQLVQLEAMQLWGGHGVKAGELILGASGNLAMYHVYKCPV